MSEYRPATAVTAAPNVRSISRLAFTSRLPFWLRTEHLALEQLGWQAEPRGFQPVEALGPYPRAEEVPLGHPVLVHTCLLEAEQVVHAYDIPFHARDLRDLDDLA